MLFGYSIFLLHVYLPDSLGAALARILRAVNKHIELSERLKPKVRRDKNFSRSILTCLSLESYLPAPLPFLRLKHVKDRIVRLYSGVYFLPPTPSEHSPV